MRALTVQQPWAWAIIHGGKDVENRTRALTGGYRGPVAIHTSKRWSGLGARAGVVWDALKRERGIPTGPASALDQWPRLFPFGAFIGVVDLVNEHPSPTGSRCCGEWADSGAVHLVVRDPRPLDEPIPYRGRLGLWTPPPDTLDELREGGAS